MGKKKDSVSKRMDRAKDQPSFMVPGYDDRSPVWALRSKEQRMEAANQATTLVAVPWGESPVLLKLFKEYRRDHHDPWCWRGLLFEFAAARYGIKPEGGRPPEWTPGECERFTDDYNIAVTELREEGRKRRSKLLIAERMCEKFPGRYPQKPDTLVKYFSSHLVRRRARK
jgi:hypothetical protein